MRTLPTILIAHAEIRFPDYHITKLENQIILIPLVENLINLEHCFLERCFREN